MGAIIRAVIGLILLVAAGLLYFKAEMPWTALIALIIAICCFIGAFFPARKKEKAKEEEPKIGEGPRTQQY